MHKDQDHTFFTRSNQKCKCGWKHPIPFRIRKSSSHEHRQYWGGGPPGKTVYWKLVPNGREFIPRECNPHAPMVRNATGAAVNPCLSE